MNLYSELAQGRLVLSTFVLSHVADADARLLVHDGADALAIGDGGVCRAAQADRQAIADDRYGDQFASLTKGEAQRTLLELIVAAGGGRVIERIV